jgi:hypothetical protein
MKSKGLEILVNVLFWVGSAWIIVNSFSIESQELELIDGQEFVRIVRNQTIILKLLLCIGVAFVAFYVNFRNISQLYKTAHKNRVILSSLLIFAATVIVYLVLEKFNPGELAIGLPGALSMGILFFYYTVSCGYGIVRLWIRSERQKQQLLLAKKQAELNLLRNQLQPHFLFNALNNLLSMVEQQNSPQLADSFERLSQLLRYVIEETKNEKVSLEKEIGFIKNYASLQSLRFADGEVDFILNITGETAGHTIEPGLLINFVENAFKFGTRPEKNTTIEVDFDLRQKDAIIFRIKNRNFNYFSESETTGTGINAIRERLDLVYPNKYQLNLTKNDHYLVELRIQTR